MVLCCLVLTSCWEDFNDKLIAPTKEAPPIKMSSNCTLTTTEATLEWAEPDAVAYMGRKITCTGNGTTTETTVNRGTTAYTITGLSSSYEYTITLSALYSTGYAIESSKFSVTPTAKTMRFIYTAAELNDVRNGGRGDYCILMADIDLSGYSNGTGWNPISTFTGIFDGNGHTIRNLTINDSTGNYKGLFGQTSGSTIKNLGLNNVSVTGYQWVGGLAGSSGAGTTTNCYVNGTVNGAYQYIGGLIGQLTSGTITYCYSTGSVTGTFQGVGGLVGFNVSGISECHSSANVSGGISTAVLWGIIRALYPNVMRQDL